MRIGRTDIVEKRHRSRARGRRGRLDVAEETVKGYMKAIFSKLGAHDRTHAVTIAAKRGIIEI